MTGGRAILRSLVIAVMVMTVSLSFIGSDLISDESDAMVPSASVYYDSLTADGKVAYDAFVEYGMNESTGDLVISIDHKIESEDMSCAVMAFKWEHPEYFWMDIGESYIFNNVDSVTMSVEFIGPVEGATDKSAKIDELQALVSAEVAKYDFDEILTYELIKGFHDRMINECRYDVVAAEEHLSDDNAYNILGVFLEGQAVCQGYSMAMKYLCDLAGVPCINVSGNAFDEVGASAEPHMWNYVMMEDGLWYCIDTTWDDPITSNGRDVLRYDFFLVGADTVIDGMRFIESHVPAYTGSFVTLGTGIPTVASASPYKLSDSAFSIRPDSEGDVNYLIGDGGNGQFTLTRDMIDPDSEGNILYRIGEGGKATVIANGVKFTMSFDAVMQILSEMKSTGTDSFTFGCLFEKVTLVDLFGKEYEKDSVVPYMLNGVVPVLDLEDVGTGMDIRDPLLL